MRQQYWKVKITRLSYSWGVGLIPNSWDGQCCPAYSWGRGGDGDGMGTAGIDWCITASQSENEFTYMYMSLHMYIIASQHSKARWSIAIIRVWWGLVACDRATKLSSKNGDKGKKNPCPHSSRSFANRFHGSAVGHQTTIKLPAMQAMPLWIKFGVDYFNVDLLFKFAF